jgi:NADPH:quinone reductase-like Zn-dependent oxidoreductase
VWRPPPFAPGWDISGVVVARGYGVTRFELGNRVFGMPWFPRRAGGYAEYVTAPALQLARMPDGLSFIEAAALPLAALTAWQSLEAARVGVSSRVVVHGAGGGVGHLAVQPAAALGAEVVATGRHDTPPTHDVDRALDLVGGTETDAALAALRPGRLLLAIADGTTAALKAETERRDVRILNPLVELDARGLDRIAQLVAQGDVRPRVASILQLEQAAEAHRRLEAGGVGGKLVAGDAVAPPPARDC